MSYLWSENWILQQVELCFDHKLYLPNAMTWRVLLVVIQFHTCRRYLQVYITVFSVQKSFANCFKIKFCGKKFCELLKAKLTTPTVLNFCEENLRKRPPICEISLPRKFPAILYANMLILGLPDFLQENISTGNHPHFTLCRFINNNY